MPNYYPSKLAYNRLLDCSHTNTANLVVPESQNLKLFFIVSRSTALSALY